MFDLAKILENNIQDLSENVPNYKKNEHTLHHE